MDVYSVSARMTNIITELKQATITSIIRKVFTYGTSIAYWSERLTFQRMRFTIVSVQENVQ